MISGRNLSLCPSGSEIGKLFPIHKKPGCFWVQDRQLLINISPHLGILLIGHKLSQEQRQSIDAICYLMESTDDLIGSTIITTEKFYKMTDDEIENLKFELNSDYEDIIVNLKRLVEMCDNYCSKKYRIIITKNYKREDYLKK